ncbi:MAG: hemerythrin domain-containing protein [Chloroflexales bacterium]|nr:hemerythrin domain-containing protein [Chloroflexales bacterium]
MKRHPVLIPLSHEHRQALFAAQIIKYGISRYKGAPTTTQEKLAYIQSFHQEQLGTHFQFEEEVLFPLVRGRDDIIDRLLTELAEEHALIIAHMNTLDQGDDCEQKLDRLGHALEAHIRKEERQFFERLQAVLGDEGLMKLKPHVESYQVMDRMCRTELSRTAPSETPTPN